MEFNFKSRTVKEWCELQRKVPRLNYLQSLPYGRAVRLNDHKSCRLATIEHENQIIGLMSIQEITLGPFHFINLYRGPLWFKESPPKEWVSLFIKEFSKKYPRRPLRRRRLIVESNQPEINRLLEENGFKSKNQSYETLWLDLTKDREDLRSGLKQKWRNALNKAEKSDIQVETDDRGSTLGMFLAQYDKDKSEKKYVGRSTKFIKDEVMMAKPLKAFFIKWAVRDNQLLAAVLVIMHGKSATYRVGFTTDYGRKFNAHNLLLWDTCMELRDRGIHSFDLGGIEPSMKQGFNKFKLGMGAETFKTPGLYS